jgi:prohibitin 2
MNLPERYFPHGALDASTVLRDAAIVAAKAQAEALRIQNAALVQSKDVLELRRIEVERIKAEKWDGALPTQVLSSITPFMQFTPPPSREREQKK